MTIGDAVKSLKDGKRVMRAGWNGKGMYLWLNPAWFPVSPYSQIWPAFVVMHTAQGTEVPWLCSQTDLLAEDWEEAT